MLGNIKNVLHFSTQKKVKIHDWRLGSLLRAAQLLVIIYAFLRFFWLRDYLSSEIPSNHLHYSAIPTNSFIEAQLGGLSGGLCSSASLQSYSYNHSEAFGSLKISGCEALPLHAMARVGQDGNNFAFMTSQEKVVEKRVPAESGDMDDAACEVFMKSTPEGAVCTRNDALAATYRHSPIPTDFSILQRESSSFGTCICEVQSVVLETGLELALLSIEHDALSYGVESSEDLTPFPLPKTFIRVGSVDAENKKVITKGEPINFTLMEVFDWLDIDLDQPINRGTNGRRQPEGYPLEDLRGEYNDQSAALPKPRLTGLTVHMEMNYYNYDRTPGAESVGQGTALCVVVLKPVFRWTVIEDSYKSTGDQIYTRERSFGVVFSAEVGGEVLQPSNTRIIDILLDMVVMVQAVNTAVSFLARFGLGDRSILYGELITEKISIVSAYARFAIQAVVAAAFFDWMDTDGDECIDYNELLDKVNATWDNKESSQLLQNLCLTDMTMAHADSHGTASLEDENNKKSKYSEGRRVIERSDFVEMFTGPPGSLLGVQALTRTRINNGWQAGAGLDKAVKMALAGNYNIAERDEAAMASITEFWTKETNRSKNGPNAITDSDHVKVTFPGGDDARVLAPLRSDGISTSVRNWSSRMKAKSSLLNSRVDDDDADDNQTSHQFPACNPTELAASKSHDIVDGDSHDNGRKSHDDEDGIKESGPAPVSLAHKSHADEDVSHAE